MKQIGEKGMPEHSFAGVEDPRVVAFFQLVRDTPRRRVEEIMRAILREAESSGDVEMLVDAFVIAFQTRNCRGGKGERRLWCWMMIFLYREGYAQTVCQLLFLVPHFGYWKDIFSLLEICAQDMDTDTYEGLRERAVALCVAQLSQDLDESSCAERCDQVPRLSLLGKYLPREKSHADKACVGLIKCLAQAIARLPAALALFDGFDGDAAAMAPKALYRKVCAHLNRLLDTPEVLMAARRWAEIDYEKVASLCLSRHRKAFMKHASEKLREAIKESKLKGKQCMPHQLVQMALRLGAGWPTCPSCTFINREGARACEMCGQRAPPREDLEADVVNGQWQCLVDDVAAQLQAEARRRLGVESSGPAWDLGRVVSLVDVSGSMHGEPLEAAVGLGLLTSELAQPAFRGRVITFESEPQWCSVDTALPFSERVALLQDAPWGNNTNFVAALELILEVCVSARIPADDVPDLIVYSDMQFDEAGEQDDDWCTMHEYIEGRFHDAGIQAVGEPYPVPTITYWNLRNTAGAPTVASAPGVRMLSGFSPALLKLVMEGEELAEQPACGEGDLPAAKKPNVTPYQTMRRSLDDPLYHVVRAVLGASKEGALAQVEAPPEYADARALLAAACAKRPGKG